MRLRPAFYFVLTLLGLCAATQSVAQESAVLAETPIFQLGPWDGFTSDDAPAPTKSLTSDEDSNPSSASPSPDQPALATEQESDSTLNLRTEQKIGSTIPFPAQPAFANENADLWERIREGFVLSELDSPLVKEHEAWYASRPDYVGRMVERSQRYLFHIVEEIEKRGMPTEIALLPMIESAFNPMAYSTSHASGIWQFIPSTGKHFGLDQNMLYDGRRDILAATDAALDYLQKLYDMFGNWELALAAYNWGEGSVSRAIARNQANGEAGDYLSLRMPPETRNYVPKLIAVKNIVMNPSAYGLTLNSIPNSPYFAQVKLKQHMDVAVAARLAEVPLDEFVALNPAYKKPLVAGKSSPTLLLPVDKANSFSLNLENYDRPLSSWQTYTPRRGEKLATIANRFGISLARLKEINSITGRKKQIASQTLLVPVGKTGQTPTLLAHIPEPDVPPASAQRSTNIHIVAKGDTVLNIAKRYGMTPAELKSRNNMKSNNIARGQKLTVVASAKSGKAAAMQVAAKSGKADPASTRQAKQQDRNKTASSNHYVVKRGDTVYSIARRFNVAVNDLQRWNRIPADFNLQPGNKLMVSRKS